MRLLKLSANKDTFRPVFFNRSGLSLVVAEQQSDTADPTATYNGVGKSLMFAIIHYCLGSNKIPGFERHLKGWIFYLTIEVDGAEHVIGRSAEDSSAISINGEDSKLKELRRFLGLAAFGPSRPDTLTFRSLISIFARSGRSAYSEFSIANQGDQKQPYQAMLRSAYLLGLNLKLAKIKRDLRAREQKLKDTMKQLEQDPVFSQLLAEETVEIELGSLTDEAKRLKEDIAMFKVAEDYHDIELEADNVKKRLDKSRRQSLKIREAIEQITRSLETKGDLPADRVIALYREAQAELPDRVTRRIEEVVHFQQELQQRRVYRLSEEKKRLQNEHSEIIKSITAFSTALDMRMRYLSEHRALDEYVAVNARLSELQRQISRIEDSKGLRDKVDKELKTIDRDLAEGNIETDDYLDSAQELIKEASNLFREFAVEMYGKRKSGLQITNDSGGNQLRYRIDTHISGDAAEGINEAKIFCFDMTVLSLARGHHVKFIAHDTPMFSPVDPRQRFAMFKIADRVCSTQRLQYIAALNLHDITSIKEQVGMPEGEFDRLFGDSKTVLRLTDESPSKKLLGIDIDMTY
ncbi:MAG: DUF2326 domain-containing protein [Phycisphaerales bacterium]